jgi:oxygen-independent coproporphyrinogen-3 oxidase
VEAAGPEIQQSNNPFIHFAPGVLRCGVLTHLYVHIPFCPKVCPYCSFYKEASDRNKTQRFLDSVLLELDRRQEEEPVRPETIFFGGGTPSALSTRQLEYLLGGLRERLDLSGLREWTLEMNPATVSLEKAQVLRDLGVNRISMGVQSWDERLLKVLGRVHDAKQAERSYEILREAGFTKVNLDLIFGVPTQTSAEWETSLRRTIALGPEHISAYCLTYEEDTQFFARFRRGELTQDVNFDADLFEMTMDVLGGAGYAQYEISNYARRGEECRHNLAYWQGRDYLGLGPSAFSTRGDRRWQNIADTSTYGDRIQAGEFAEGFQEQLSDEMRRSETAAFSLRTDRGVEAAVGDHWSDDFARFEADGFVTREDGRWLLTRRGKMVADELAEAFV